jgi:hypothetical protein
MAPLISTEKRHATHRDVQSETITNTSVVFAASGAACACNGEELAVGYLLFAGQSFHEQTPPETSRLTSMGKSAPFRCGCTRELGATRTVRRQVQFRSFSGPGSNFSC